MLEGETFISTGYKRLLKNQELCQWSERGDLHFYVETVEETEEVEECVNALERGDLHLYSCLWKPA